MARPTPERVDPWLLSEQEAVLEGSIALSALPRLAPLLRESGGEVSYRFRFGRDEHGRSVIHSSVKAELRLECQRCLNSMSHQVDAEGALALVRGPLEAEQLPRELDPLLLQEKELLQVRELVEDELLLSIPVSPRHAAGSCSGHTHREPEEPAAQQEKPNPFAVLAALKTGGNHS